MRADGSLLPPLDLPRGVTDEPLERLAPIRLGSGSPRRPDVSDQGRSQRGHPGFGN